MVVYSWLQDYVLTNDSTNNYLKTMETICRLRHSLLQNCCFTWEYYNYITAASIIAVIGLITDSSTTIMASMVISPVTNYVLAVTFGTFLCDGRLFRIGVIGLVQSLLFCVFFGLCAGLIFSKTIVITHEMSQRTDIRNLYWSIFVAFFSGLVSSSCLVTEKNNNLIGIAISTSLLPSAVNFGLLLPNSLLEYHNGIVFHKTLISLAITFANIFLIYVSVLLGLWIYSLDLLEKQQWITHVPSMRCLELEQTNLEEKETSSL